MLLTVCCGIQFNIGHVQGAETCITPETVQVVQNIMQAMSV